MKIQPDISVIVRNKKQNKKRMLWALLLIALNVLLYTTVTKDQTMPERFKTAIFGFVIGYNLLGFVLGTLIALLPYKQLPYGNKYLRASLMTILALQSILTFGLICLLMMTFAGWY